MGCYVIALRTFTLQSLLTVTLDRQCIIVDALRIVTLDSDNIMGAIFNALLILNVGANYSHY